MSLRKGCRGHVRRRAQAKDDEGSQILPLGRTLSYSIAMQAFDARGTNVAHFWPAIPSVQCSVADHCPVPGAQKTGEGTGFLLRGKS